MAADPEIMTRNILSLVDGSNAVAGSGLTVDIIGDFTCPWSYLGKNRLDQALGAVQGAKTINWYPFQVHPDLPAEGLSLNRFLNERFGTTATALPALAQLENAGAAEGAIMNFARIGKVPNTELAHRLMQAAAQSGAQHRLAGALYQAFFEHGADIGNAAVLRDIAADSGLPAAIADNAFDDEVVGKIVAANEARVRRAGIGGVPNFLLNKRLFVVGAQDPLNLVNAIDQALFGAGDDEAGGRLH